MGVDYDGVGGVGILITEYILDTAWKKVNENIDPIKEEVAHDEDDDDDDDEWSVDDKLEKIGIRFSQAGDGCYGGEDRYYWKVTGDTLPEIIGNAPKFIAELGSMGINITMDDIKVIEDLSIW